MPPLVRLSLALMVLLVTSVAAAGKGAPTPDQQARKLYQAGEAAFTAGRFTDAVESFQAAYEISHNRKLLWNIAQSWRRQNEITGDVADLRRARAVLQNFRELATSDAERTEAVTALEEVETAIAAEEAKARPPAPAAPVAAPPPAPAPTTESGGGGRSLRMIGIGLGVAGLALAATGAGLAWAGQRAFKEIDEPSPGYVFNPDTQSRMNLFRPLGYTLLGVGAAALAGGVTSYLLGARADKPRVALAPLLGPSLVGVGAGGTF